MRRNGLWTRVTRGLAALALAGTPLITTLTCDPTPDGFELFIDEEHFDTFDIIFIEEDEHEHCGIFDGCFYDHIF